MLSVKGVKNTFLDDDMNLECDDISKTFAYVSELNYHDVSIRLPSVISTVQHEEGHAHGRVVHSGDITNRRHIRKLLYNHTQHLQHHKYASTITHTKQCNQGSMSIQEVQLAFTLQEHDELPSPSTLIKRDSIIRRNGKTPDVSLDNNMVTGRCDYTQTSVITL